jgi:hypothetical protein
MREILVERDLGNQNGKRLQIDTIFVVVLARPRLPLRRTV